MSVYWSLKVTLMTKCFCLRSHTKRNNAKKKCLAPRALTNMLSRNVSESKKWFTVLTEADSENTQGGGRWGVGVWSKSDAFGQCIHTYAAWGYSDIILTGCQFVLQGRDMGRIPVSGESWSSHSS